MTTTNSDGGRSELAWVLRTPEVRAFRRYMARWKPILHLEAWEITWEVFEGDLPDTAGRGSSEHVAADVEADWRYQHAHVRLSYAAIRGKDADYIESVALHELVHAFVSHAAVRNNDHNELLVTQITTSLMLTRQEARR